MVKITFMGAGSTVFAKNVLGDCLSTETFAESEICLYDIDRQRLEESSLMLNAINKNVNQGRAKISEYLGVEQRKEALRGATFVVNAIQVGGYDPSTIVDFEIPKIRPAPDNRRHTGDWWYHARSENHSCHVRLRP